MAVRNLLSPLPVPWAIGADCEITSLGVRWDPDVNPVAYQPLLAARKKSAGTEAPPGAITFSVRFTDDTYSDTPAEGRIEDETAFVAAHPIRNQIDWYEWDATAADRTGNFRRLAAAPVDGGSAAIASGDDITITSGKTPRSIRFEWRYTG